MMNCSFTDVLRVTGARLVAGDANVTLQGLSTDTRKLQGGELFLSLRGTNFDGDAFAAQALGRGAGGLVVHKAPEAAWPQGVPLAEHPNPRRALGDLARWVRGQHAGHVIGITGSCGKTSTKEILVQLLEKVQTVHGSPASYNNDIGVPLTIMGAPVGAQTWVVEMGTNAPGEIANLCRIAQPTGAVLTNIGEAHLAGLGSASGVAQEKGALVESLGPDHFCVLNADCRFTAGLKNRTAARVITFGLQGDADISGQNLLFSSGATTLDVVAGELPGPVRVSMPLLGSHMVQNLLAALAAAQGMGIPLAELLPHVGTLRGAGRRMQLHQIGDMTLIDDSYNANPLSVLAGIRQLASMDTFGRRILVVGDMLELGEHADGRHLEVGRQAALNGVDVLVAVGEHAQSTVRGAREQGMPRENTWALADTAECLSEAPRWIGIRDTVLVKASRSMGLERLVEQLLSTETVI